MSIARATGDVASVTVGDTRGNEDESPPLPPKPNLELALSIPSGGEQDDPESPILQPPSPRLLDLVIEEPPLGACFKTICGHVLVERIEHYSPVLAAGVTPGCVLVSIGDQMMCPEACDSAVEVLNKLAAIGSGGSGGSGGGSDGSGGSASGGSVETPVAAETDAPAESAEKEEEEEEQEEHRQEQQEQEDDSDDLDGYFVTVTAEFPLVLSFRRHAESSLDMLASRQGLRHQFRQRSRVVVDPNVTAGIANRTAAMAATIAASDAARATNAAAAAAAEGPDSTTAAAAAVAMAGSSEAPTTVRKQGASLVSPGETDLVAASDGAAAAIGGTAGNADAGAVADDSMAPPEESEEAAEWSPWDPLPQGDPGKEEEGAAVAQSVPASKSTVPTLDDLETARLALEGNGGGAWRPDLRGWPLPSGDTLEQASAAGGVSSVGAAELEQVTRALGSRVPPGLAAHLLRARGGDVAGALELYYAVAEEFIELSARAGGCGSRRLRRGESSSDSAGQVLIGSASADAGCNGSGGGGETHGAAGGSDGGGGGGEAGELITRQGRDLDFPMFEASAEAIAARSDEYEVSIESDKLGMTVENVLERTVVRAVSPGSAADKAGVETGSLLTSLGGQCSRSMSHFETIEQLRQAQRPLVLRLRRVEPERLQRRRAEMRALIHPQDSLLNPRAAAASDALASRGFPVAESVVRSNGRRGFLSSMASAAAAGFSGGGSSSHSSPAAVNSGATGAAAAAAAADGGDAAAAARSTGGSSPGGASLALLPTLGSTIGPDPAYGQPFDPDDPSAAVAAATAATAAIVSWAEERLLSVLRLLCVGQALRGGGPHVVPDDSAATAAVEPRTGTADAGTAAAAAAATAAATNSRVGSRGSSSSELQAADAATALPPAAPAAVATGEEAAAAVLDAAALPPLPPTVAAAQEAAAVTAQEAIAEAASEELIAVKNTSALAAADEENAAAAIASAAAGSERGSGRTSTAPATPEKRCPTETYIPVLSAMQVVLEWNQGVAGANRAIGRRIEDMSAVLDQLAAVIDWGDETVHAVEYDMRELLCLLLDVDRNFDLTSATFPGTLGGAVAVLLRELVLHLDEEQLCTQMVPLVQRLAVSQSVTSRVACCSIVPLVYGGLPLPQQLQLRGVLSRFVHDITASVRKEAAEAIQAVADVADSSAVSWLLLLCERAACDAEFSVRRVAVGTCLHLADKLPAVLRAEERLSVQGMEKSSVMARAYYREAHLLQCKLLPVVTRLAEDSDWQVRLAVARHCDCLCAALGAQWTAVMVDVLQNLLQDVDMEVRSEAVHCLPRLAHAMLQLAAEGAVTGQVGADASAVANAASMAASPAATGPGKPVRIVGTAAATAAMETEVAAAAAAATTSGRGLDLPPIVPYSPLEKALSLSKVDAPKPSTTAAAPAPPDETGNSASVAEAAAGMRGAGKAATAAATLAEAQVPLAPGAATATEDSATAAAAATAARMAAAIVPFAPLEGPSRELSPHAAAENGEKLPESEGSPDWARDEKFAGCDAVTQSIEQQHQQPEGAGTAVSLLSSLNPAEGGSEKSAAGAAMPTASSILTVAAMMPLQRRQNGISDGSSSTSGFAASPKAGCLLADAKEAAGAALSANVADVSVPVAALVEEEEEEHLPSATATAAAAPASSKEVGLASSCNGTASVPSVTGAPTAAASAAATAAEAVAGKSNSNALIGRQATQHLSRDAWLQSQAKVLDALVPPATKLISDPAPEVRAALAAAVGDLLRLITGPWADAAAAIDAPLPEPSPIERLPSIGEGEVLDGLLSPSPPPASSSSYLWEGTAGDAISAATAAPCSSPAPSTYSAVVEVVTAQWAVDQLLVPLVQQLLQDSDLMVAAAMLQGLRPAATIAARGASAWLGAAASSGGGAMTAVAAMEGSSGCQGRPGSIIGSGAGSRSSVGAVVVSTAGSSDILFFTPAFRSSSSTSEENESARVRVHMPPLLTAPQVGCVLHAIEQLAASRQWRTRQAAVEALPALAGGAADKALRRRVTALLARLLEDPVDAVRRAAAEHTCVAARADFDRCPGRGRCAGDDCPLGCGSWMCFVLLPQLAGLQAARSFRSRMLVLYTIQALISVGLATSELLQNVLVPAVNRAAGDPLANVRMSAARVVEELAAASLRTPRLRHPAAMESLLCIASALRGDPDRDVAYYAGRALVHFLAPTPQPQPTVTAPAARRASRENEGQAPPAGTQHRASAC